MRNEVFDGMEVIVEMRMEYWFWFLRCDMVLVLDEI